MTTSLVLDNSLYESAVAVAAARGKTFEEFVSEAVQAAVAEAAELQLTMRDGLPCVQPSAGTPPIDPSKCGG